VFPRGLSGTVGKGIRVTAAVEVAGYGVITIALRIQIIINGFHQYEMFEKQ